ncbi:MAG: sulfatase-like hydrolase/transferase, partial [Phycisphaerae bacterium]
MNGDDSALIMHHALKFIEESVSQKHPFFAVIWFHAPHQPVVAGPEDRAAYAKYSEDQQHYFGAVTALDRQIGRLREQLRSLHSDRGTMVWFCSDNGPEGNPGPSGRNQGSAGNLR